MPNSTPTDAPMSEEEWLATLADAAARELPAPMLAECLRRAFNRHRFNHPEQTSCSFGDAAQSWFVLCAATPARVREVEEIMRSLSGVKDKIDPITDVLRQQVAILEAENRRLREQLAIRPNHPTRGH